MRAGPTCSAAVPQLKAKFGSGPSYFRYDRGVELKRGQARGRRKVKLQWPTKHEELELGDRGDAHVTPLAPSEAHQPVEQGPLHTLRHNLVIPL